MLRPSLWKLTIVGILIVTSKASVAAPILNYQFESIDSTTIPGSVTTPDSTGTYTSSATVNALLGDGSTPGVNFPQLTSGFVSNSLYQSLNPNSYMYFPGSPSTGSSASSVKPARVEIAKASAGALDQPQINFSFAAWVNPTAVGFGDPVTIQNRFIAAKVGQGTASSNRGWQILAAAPNSNPVNGLVNNGGGDDLEIDFSQNTSGSPNPNISIMINDVLPLNTWTHVAFTFDGTTPVVYINGLATTPTGFSTTTPGPNRVNGTNSAAFMVADRGSNSQYGWIGGIDDVRVYTETLDAAGVQALLVPIPEPSTFAVIIAGIFGLAFVRVRKNA